MEIKYSSKCSNKVACLRAASVASNGKKVAHYSEVNGSADIDYIEVLADNCEASYHGNDNELKASDALEDISASHHNAHTNDEQDYLDVVESTNEADYLEVFEVDNESKSSHYDGNNEADYLEVFDDGSRPTLKPSHCDATYDADYLQVDEDGSTSKSSYCDDNNEADYLTVLDDGIRSKPSHSNDSNGDDYLEVIESNNETDQNGSVQSKNNAFKSSYKVEKESFLDNRKNPSEQHCQNPRESGDGSLTPTYK